MNTQIRNRLSAKQQVTRNVLVLVGALTLSEVASFLLESALIPISNRMIFHGDFGNIMMWAWNGHPDALAAIVVVKIIETRKLISWIVGLSALYLYTGSLGAWRLLSRWRIPPRTSDYIGIGIKSVLPALVCLVAGIWTAKISASKEQASAVGDGTSVAEEPF